MAVRDLARKLTYEDYVLIPEDGRRHEILDGEHYVSPSPVIRHQDVVGNLHFALSVFNRAHRLGKILLAPTDVVLSPHDVVVPDLLFVSNERLDIVAEENVQGAPDLIVEVLSKRTRQRDEGLKLHLYERHEVREYWLLDPDGRTAKVFRRSGKRLTPAASLSAESGDVLTTPLLPGLSVPLGEIFA
jgi:Uma2 family endonuclease